MERTCTCNSLILSRCLAQISRHQFSSTYSQFSPDTIVSSNNLASLWPLHSGSSTSQQQEQPRNVADYQMTLPVGAAWFLVTLSTKEDKSAEQEPKHGKVGGLHAKMTVFLTCSNQAITLPHWSWLKNSTGWLIVRISLGFLNWSRMNASTRILCSTRPFKGKRFVSRFFFFFLHRFVYGYD